jgi:hypothetical protein
VFIHSARPGVIIGKKGAEIETLRAGWLTGLTCREIAAKLPGRGKSAVGGMAHRLGLTLRAPEKANGLALCAPRRHNALGLVGRGQ